MTTLQWLRREGFNLSERIIEAGSPYELGVMAAAIKSGNIELIRYCKDLDFGFEVQSLEECDCLAIATGNIDLIRYCSELGCEFTERVLDCVFEHITTDSLIFLRGESLLWSPETINKAAESNQFELLKYAHEIWSELSQETWKFCLKQKPRINWDMVHYLYENKCPWEPELDLKDVNNASDRLRILEFIFSKKLSLDVQVLLNCINKKWLKEAKFIIDNTSLEDINMPEDLTFVAENTSPSRASFYSISTFGNSPARQHGWKRHLGASSQRHAITSAAS